MLLLDKAKDWRARITTMTDKVKDWCARHWKFTSCGLFCLVVLFSMGACPVPCGASSHHTVSAGDTVVDSRARVSVGDMFWLERYVMDIGEQMNRLLYDVDKNGKMNCVDYAVVFRQAHMKVGENPNSCIIVWNKNSATDMNHVFVAVRAGNTRTWYLIEPKVALYDDPRFLMADWWGDRYNPGYNTYDSMSELYKKCLTNTW